MFLFGPPNIEKLKVKSDIRDLIKALAYRKDWRVREAAAKALGEIKDARAIEPLIARLKDNHQSVRLASYSALEQIPGNNIAENEIQNLIESLAEEIRRLSSRTRINTDIVHVDPEQYNAQENEGRYLDNWADPVREYEVEHEEPDPDIDGIRNLVACIPEKLRERIVAQSGVARSYFNDD